jgi:hypothetical protein
MCMLDVSHSTVLRFYSAIYHWHTTTTTNNNNNTIIIIVHRESSVFSIEHYISGGNGWYRRK